MTPPSPPKPEETPPASELTIAVDAMGGDHAPKCLVMGVLMASRRNPDLRFLLFGPAQRLRPYLQKNKRAASRIEVRDVANVVAPDERPSSALRRREMTSMRAALRAAAQGEAAAAFSCGNTGALMALGMSEAGRISGIDRPAICSSIPSLTGQTAVLDIGANAVCQPRNLVEFCLMGQAYARCVMGVTQPRYGLISVGTEDIKAHGPLAEAAAQLKKIETLIPGRFLGLQDGHSTMMGLLDVAVYDGFSGNIALKTIEGFSEAITIFFKKFFATTPLTWPALPFLWFPFLRVKRMLDPRLHNGAMLIGLNAVILKGHGNSCPVAVCAALERSAKLSQGGFVARFCELLSTKENLLRPDNTQTTDSPPARQTSEIPHEG